MSEKAAENEELNIEEDYMKVYFLKLRFGM